MANRYYAAGEQRAAKVKDLFTAIAHRYDLINDLQSLGFHRRWKRQLVRMTGLKPGERALDLCCGTGDVALGLAKTDGTVVGLDFSMAMLVFAGKRARKLAAHFQGRPHPRDGSESSTGTLEKPRCWDAEHQVDHAHAPGAPASGPARSGGPSNQAGPEAGAPLLPRSQITFLRGDALRVPFRDGEFDVVTISYGLRNLENIEAGLTEIRRVLKPGGRLLVLDFGKPENRLWRAVYFGYLRCCVPWLGRLFCGDREAYAYILESLIHYPAQRGVASLMERLDFKEARVIDLVGGIMSINYGRK